MAESYGSYSPYNYTLNNPVLFIDPDGRYVSSNSSYNAVGGQMEDTEDTIIENEATGEKSYINDGYTHSLKLSNDDYNAVIASAEENGGANAIAEADINWMKMGAWYVGAGMNGGAQGLADAAAYMGELYGPIIGEAIAAGIAVTLLKGPIKGTAATSTTTVGRWMSKAEYEIMKKTNRMVEGAGGKTSVSVGGSNAFPAASKGSVYAEFQVPSSSLIQGGKSNWFSILGPNASRSQLNKLQKQGGQLLPKVENLSPILKVK